MQSWFFLFLILCSHFFTVHAQNSLQSEQTLVVATYQYADNPRIKNLEPFAAHLSKQTGLKTEVRSFANVHTLLQAMKNGEADIVFMNTFGYLLLREQHDEYSIAATLHLPEPEVSVYTSIIVSSRENNLKSLTDAINRASDNFLILVNPGSTSGNLVPRLKLAAHMEGDPEMFFLEVHYAGTHQQALQEVLNEKLAVAAFGSDEYYKLGADTAKVDVLWESGPIPLGPVVYKKSLSESLRNDIQKILLDLHQDNLPALEAIRAGWTEARPADKYIVVDDTYYESLVNLAGDRARAMRIIRRFVR